MLIIIVFARASVLVKKILNTETKVLLAKTRLTTATMELLVCFVDVCVSVTDSVFNGRLHGAHDDSGLACIM